LEVLEFYFMTTVGTRVPWEPLGVSVAQRLGRQMSDLAVMDSILGLGIIRHLGQLSLPSLWGR